MELSMESETRGDTPIDAMNKAKTSKPNEDDSISQLVMILQAKSNQLVSDILTENALIQSTTAIISGLDDYLSHQIQQQTSLVDGDISPSVEAITDQIDVNFGGKCLTLDRNIICNPKVKYNFFSALFHPRWQRALPKDKAGRLYFELEFKWIQPILDAYELIYASHKYADNDDQTINLRDVTVTAESPYLDCVQTSLGIIGNNAHILDIPADWSSLSPNFVKQALFPHISQFLQLEKKDAQRILIRPPRSSSMRLYICSDDVEIICAVLMNVNTQQEVEAYRCFLMKEDSFNQNIYRDFCITNNAVDPKTTFVTISTDAISIKTTTPMDDRGRFVYSFRSTIFSMSMQQNCCVFPGK
jgi:hypothetical protein